jgi:multiple sugar transport system substrate-binding protein
MRDIGFEDPATEAGVPGLSSDISDKMLALYQGKSSTQATLDEVAKMISDKTGK